MILNIIHYSVAIIIGLITLYIIRHYIFTINRLFAKQRHPYLDIDCCNWPGVTVLIPAHNEELVIERLIRSLMLFDYPEDQLQILIINDRSTDRTKEIIDRLATELPGRFNIFHRVSGAKGKAAALKDAMQFVKNDILITFDADYTPGKGLVKQLATAFFDPEVGLVMGRAVPKNIAHNLLTRLLELERTGGYQVDQQARMNLDGVPQYGGTIGGIRKSMLESVGGWSDDMLTEDTDLTYKALMHGWKTAYHNRSECYEEVPVQWPGRIKQVMRWGKGHNQVLFRYGKKFLFSPNLTPMQRVDGAMLLSIFIMPVVMMLGWLLILILFYMEGLTTTASAIAVLSMLSYSAVGNFAPYFQIAAAVYLDGDRHRIRILPFNFANFIISTVAVVRSTSELTFDKLYKRELVWHKTPRIGDK